MIVTLGRLEVVNLYNRHIYSFTYVSNIVPFHRNTLLSHLLLTNLSDRLYKTLADISGDSIVGSSFYKQPMIKFLKLRYTHEKTIINLSSCCFIYIYRSS